MINKNKPVILLFVHYYLPGNNSGGPVRSIANMVLELGDDFHFKIVCADHDWTDSTSYEGVAINSWNKFGNCEIFYISPKAISFWFISRLIREIKFDIIYLNSFFDFNFTLKPLVAWLLFFSSKKKPLIIAPRGEFSSGALNIKKIRKKLFINLFKILHLERRVIFHVSTNYESEDVKARFESSGCAPPIVCIIASDIAALPVFNIHSERYLRKVNSLRIVFISRISPKKNLDFALRVLAKVQVAVEFNIFGPNGNDAYWEQCKALMERLPENVTVKYHGVLLHSEVDNVFQSHDLFFFPTLGENFGHVIVEALLAGTPVLIANTTPWRKLDEHGVGWDLPLTNEDEFVNKIHLSARISGEAREKWRQRVQLFALSVAVDQSVIEDNRLLFRKALQCAA